MSTIPAVMAALAVLAEATVDDDWLVINGPIGAVTTTKNNLVLVGDGDVAGTRVLDRLSAETTAEQYQVPVTVSVFVPGTDQQVADELALDVYTALERAIREDMALNLGLAAQGVVKALPIGGFTLQRTADGEARYSAVRFVLDVYAQNT